MNTQEATLANPGKQERTAGRPFLDKKRIWTYVALTLFLLLLVIGLKVIFPPVPEEALVSTNKPLIPTEPAVTRRAEMTVVPPVEKHVTQEETVPQVAHLKSSVTAERPQRKVAAAAPAVVKEALPQPKRSGATPQKRGVKDQASRKVMELSTFNMGVDALEIGNYLEAVLHFNRTLSVNPLNVRAYNNLGLALMGLGEEKTAEEVFRKGLVIEPGSIRCLNNLALLNIKRGEPARAVPFLERIVSEHPEDATAWTNLGVAEGRAGKPAAAETAYRRALQLSPQDYRIHFNLARTLEIEGRRVEAIYSYQAFLRLLPAGENNRAQQILSHLQKLQESLAVPTGRP